VHGFGALIVLALAWTQNEAAGKAAADHLIAL
jgi:hypothetical protein